MCQNKFGQAIWPHEILFPFLKDGVLGRFGWGLECAKHPSSCLSKSLKEPLAPSGCQKIFVASEFFSSGKHSNVLEFPALPPSKSEKQVKGFILMSIFLLFPQKTTYEAANFLIWLFLAWLHLIKSLFIHQHKEDSILLTGEKMLGL